ncbi:MAG: pyridoxal-phosphate dependent enzyme [Alphaproteobacteria bacterium]
MADYVLACAECGWRAPETAYHIGCPECGGFLEVALAQIPAQPLDSRFPSIFKYHRLMPYDPEREAIADLEDFEETPIFLSQPLSDALGVALYLKDETVMPSGTWKDREGFVSIHRLMISGVPDLIVFSSGNTGTSLARSASRAKGPRLHIVVPEASKARVQGSFAHYDPDYVKLHFFDGSNDECIVEANALASRLGFALEGGFSNYARREGLKLLGLELILGWGEPYDWYVQPVAGGIGVYALHKAYRDLGIPGQCPKILGVQAAICAPMVNAWRAGAATLEPRYVPREVTPSPFVRVLRTRNPADSYPILKKIMDAVGGRFEDADDDAILAALRLFYREPYFVEAYRSSGRLVGLEPATALAGIVKGVREGYIAKGARVVLNVSGAAKEGDVQREWINDVL